jgi:GcrA cell cycle regulator
MITWDADTVRRLQELCAENPQATGSEIARLMGITRNAAIGKMARLAERDQLTKPRSGLKTGSVPSGAPKKKRRPVALHPAEHLPLVPELPEPTVPDMRPCTLVELTPYSCRWPVGDPQQPGFYFCGGLKPEGTGVPYCRFHMKRARAAPRDRETRQ